MCLRSDDVIHDKKGRYKNNSKCHNNNAEITKIIITIVIVGTIIVRRMIIRNSDN